MSSVRSRDIYIYVCFACVGCVPKQREPKGKDGRRGCAMFWRRSRPSMRGNAGASAAPPCQGQNADVGVSTQESTLTTQLSVSSSLPESPTSTTPQGGDACQEEPKRTRSWMVRTFGRPPPAMKRTTSGRKSFMMDTYGPPPPTVKKLRENRNFVTWITGTQRRDSCPPSPRRSTRSRSSIDGSSRLSTPRKIEQVEVEDIDTRAKQMNWLLSALERSTTFGSLRRTGSLRRSRKSECDQGQGDADTSDLA